MQKKPTTWKDMVDAFLQGYAVQRTDCTVSSVHSILYGMQCLELKSYGQTIARLQLGKVTMVEPERSSRTTNKHIHYVKTEAKRLGILADA